MFPQSSMFHKPLCRSESKFGCQSLLTSILKPYYYMCQHHHFFNSVGYTVMLI